MKETINKSFWMLPFLELSSSMSNEFCFEVYDYELSCLYKANSIIEKNIVNELLKMTSLNFNVNSILGSVYFFCCAPIRTCTGTVTGYIILKTNDKNSIKLYKFILQVIANQTSLLLENENIKKTLLIQNIADYSVELKILTPKELLVYKYLVLGKSDSEIIDIIKISKSTLRMHMRSIFNKLSVVSRAEAIAKYYIHYIPNASNTLNQ